MIINVSSKEPIASLARASASERLATNVQKSSIDFEPLSAKSGQRGRKADFYWSD
jgi:hypothetical protein